MREWSAAQDRYARSMLDQLPDRDAVRARLAQAVDRGALGASIPRGRMHGSTRCTRGRWQRGCSLPAIRRSCFGLSRGQHGQGKPAAKVVAEETDIWSFLLNELRR